MPGAVAHVGVFIAFSHLINLHCFNYVHVWPDIKACTGGHQIPWGQKHQREQELQPLKVSSLSHIWHSYRENKDWVYFPGRLLKALLSMLCVKISFSSFFVHQRQISCVPRVTFCYCTVCALLVRITDTPPIACRGFPNALGTEFKPLFFYTFWRYFSSKNLALSTFILWCTSLINTVFKLSYFTWGSRQ